MNLVVRHTRVASLSGPLLHRFTHICDPLSENLPHPEFYKNFWKCVYGCGSESDWLLDSCQLWSKKHRGRRTQLFKKMKSFYVATCPYTIVLHKIDMCYCKKVACKSPKTLGKDSGCESGGFILCLQTERQPYTNWKLVKSFFFGIV